MSLVIFLLIAFFLIFSVELIKRKLKLSSYVTRKISHIGAAIIAAIAPFYVHHVAIVLSCLGFALILLLGRKTTIFSSIHDITRKSFGEVFLPLGEAISATLFLPTGVREFQFGVLVMGICDGLAGLVGERYGKKTFQVLGNTKSIEGSAAFFISCVLLTFVFMPTFGFHLFIIPAILAVIELFLGFGTDNLVLPTAGSILFILFRTV